MRVYLSIVALVFFGCAPPVLQAQTTGVVEGSVLDPGRAAVQGAVVKLTESATESVRITQTSANGWFIVPGLAPGVYRIEVSRAGFQTAIREDVRLSAGRTVRTDFEMTVGELRQTLIVTGQVPLVSTSASDSGGTIDRTQLADLPLVGRDLFDLAAQQPAVAIANNNEGAIFNGLGIQPSVNGNRPNQNSFRLDGVYVNDASGSAPASAGGRLLGIEAIEELRLIVNPFNAEYGRAASAVFTAVSRAGSNDWHGSTYYFMRNSALDARNFFDSPREKIPDLRRRHFGGLISGPVRPNRLFVLVNYEGLKESRSRTQRATTLTAPARQGLLPRGTVTVNSSVKPFLELYPMPNGQDFGDGSAEFVSLGQATAGDHYVVARADYLATERVRTSLRFSSDKGNADDDDSFLLWKTKNDSRFVFLQSESTVVQSPSTLHSLRFAYSRVRNTEDAIPPPSAADLTFASGRPIGTMEVTGLTDMTSQTVSSLPRLHVLQDYQTNYEATHTRQAHTFRFGAGFDTISFQQLGDFRANGRYRFTSITNLLRATPSGGDLMAPGSDTSRLWRQNQYAFFAQEEFRASRRLNLMIGVRYETYSSPSEAGNKIANLREPLHATMIAVGGPLFNNPSKGNFAPRAASAWDLFGTGRTVVRAGAGMFFDLLTSREVTIAGMRVPPFYNRAFMTNPTFPNLLAAAANAKIDGSMDGLAYNMQQPYVLQFRFSVAQQIGSLTALEAGYSGSRGVHLLGQFGDLNVA